jgi:hypothetical protein
MVCGITEGRHPVPIEKTSKPNYPQSVVDAVAERTRGGSINITREYVVGTIELGVKGMPALEAAFRMIGREVLASGSPRSEDSSTFAFTYGGERYRVTVAVEDA